MCTFSSLERFITSRLSRWGTDGAATWTGIAGLDLLEHLFENERVSAAPAIADLQQRIAALQQSSARESLGSLEGLEGTVRVAAGGVYSVEHASLGLALLAGVSRAGGWCAVVGTPDLGYERGAELGLDVQRTVVVPDPGEEWVEVTSALIDVTQVVLVRPPARVSPRVASLLAARLRRRSSALVSWGPWPGSDLRLRVEQSRWEGLGLGHGHLRSCAPVIGVERGASPPRRWQWNPPATAAGWS